MIIILLQQRKNELCDDMDSSNELLRMGGQAFVGILLLTMGRAWDSISNYFKAVHEDLEKLRQSNHDIVEAVRTQSLKIYKHSQRLNALERKKHQ